MKLKDCLGKRVLVRAGVLSELADVTVVEVTPSGCVRIVYPDSHTRWLDTWEAEVAFIRDVLPEARP